MKEEKHDFIYDSIDLSHLSNIILVNLQKWFLLGEFINVFNVKLKLI